MTMTSECKAGKHEKCSGTTITVRGNREIMVRDPRKPKKKNKAKVPVDRLEGPHDYDPCGCKHHAKLRAEHRFPDGTAVLLKSAVNIPNPDYDPKKKGSEKVITTKEGQLLSHDNYDKNSRSWVCTVKVGKKSVVGIYESTLAEKEVIIVE